MPAKVTPFLMFEGKAGEAMAFYVSLFPDARIMNALHYGSGEAGPEGSVKQATFSIGGQAVRCTDSFVKHDFAFTPAFSFFVECGSEEELSRLFDNLSPGGMVFMPMGDYGFSRRFAWISDRFGVSWQLNLS